jgi:uncharacterized protein YcnI
MRLRVASVLTAAAAAATFAWPSPAGAHTDTDLVAVAAGESATLTLKPTHGCDGSPTVEVAIQAPVGGATAGEVEGWTATTTVDEAADRTVLEWTGGSLPADAEGAFPVEFTVPDAVGELLVFPAVQVCEDGEELAWIDGDPEGEYPAPRILVLPAGTPAAASIDDVPPDAPGRDQLSAIVDVDNPASETTVAETTPESSEESSAPETSADDTSTTGADDVAAEPISVDEDEAEDDGDDGSSAGLLAAIAVAVVVVAGGAYALTRRKAGDRAG